MHLRSLRLDHLIHLSMRIRQKFIFSTTREQKGLDTIGVRHDGYHAIYEVLFRHMVNHSRPASVSVTFVSFFNILLLFCNKKPFKPRRVVALHWFGEYISSFCSSQGFLGFSYPAVSQVIG